MTSTDPNHDNRPPGLPRLAIAAVFLVLGVLIAIPLLAGH